MSKTPVRPRSCTGMAGLIAVGVACALFVAPHFARAEAPSFDVLIRGGTVYDGSGAPPRRADVGIRGDRIEAVGDLAGAAGGTVLDATGLAVAPGFVNMLSWAVDDLLADPRSQGDIRQGVTTEVFGEGESYGPWSEPMKVRRRAMQGDFRYEITWTTLAEYLRLLERRGRGPERGLVRGHRDDPRARGRPRRREAHSGPARRDARPRPARDGGGGARDRLVAHLRPGLVQLPGGPRRAGEGRRAVRGPVHHPHAQRGRPAPRSGGRDDPRGARGGDPHRDLPPQGGGRGELAEARAGGREDRSRPARRAEGHRRHVHVHGGGHRLRRLPAAVEPRGRLGTHLRAHPRRGDARAHPEGDARAGRRLGEPVPPRRLSRADQARGLPERGLEAAHGEDARRGRGGAGPEPRGHRPRPRGRGRVADRRRLLPHVGGQRPPADPAPLGLVRLRRGLDGARGRLPEVLDPPPRLRQLRSPPRPLRARRGAGHARGGGAAADLVPGGQPRPRPARPARCPATSPTWSSSTRRRSPTGRRTRAPTSTRPACATSSSTGSPCCATASTRGRSRAAPSAGRDARRRSEASGHEAHRGHGGQRLHRAPRRPPRGGVGLRGGRHRPLGAGGPGGERGRRVPGAARRPRPRGPRPRARRLPCGRPPRADRRRAGRPDLRGRQRRLHRARPRGLPPRRRAARRALLRPRRRPLRHEPPLLERLLPLEAGGGDDPLPLRPRGRRLPPVLRRGARRRLRAGGAAGAWRGARWSGRATEPTACSRSPSRTPRTP